MFRLIWRAARILIAPVTLTAGLFRFSNRLLLRLMSSPGARRK